MLMTLSSNRGSGGATGVARKAGSPLPKLIPSSTRPRASTLGHLPSLGQSARGLPPAQPRQVAPFPSGVGALKRQRRTSTSLKAETQ